MSRLSGAMPLAGWRVLDLGIITAGAATSALLADAGADVIKIESKRYPDPFRSWLPGSRNAAQETSPVFDFTNRNKSALAIDLKRAEGRDLFLDLVVEADVVLENFRRGVLEQLGISWETMRRRNPRLVLASISSQGETGPDRVYTSYGSTLEATGGLAAISGYPDGPPVITGRAVNYPDQIVSICAMGLTVAAVLHARREGTGARLDISQREVTAFLVGEAIAAALASPPQQSRAVRLGNADPAGGRRGCVATADGQWIAVEIPSDGPEVADVAAAVAELDRNAALVWARSADVAATPVLTGAEALAISRRGDDGRSVGHAFAEDPSGQLAKGFPFRSRAHPFSVRNSAPRVGQDSDAVLERLLGVDAATRAKLRANGVI